jgi:hypothetical protein
MIIDIFVLPLCDYYWSNLVILQCLSYTFKLQESCIGDFELLVS